MNIRGLLERLINDLERGTARYEGSVEGMKSNAKALVNNVRGVLERNDELEKKVADTDDRVRDADLRTDRVRDAAVRYYDAVASNAPADVLASCEKRLLAICGSSGREAQPYRYHQHLEALRRMADSRSWGVVTVGTEQEGHFVATRDIITWLGATTIAHYHPREHARILLRDVFGYDPDTDDRGTFFDADGNRTINCDQEYDEDDES